ncbi:MAG: NIPSNAP family protein [Bacteroidetes bacterium]|nr:NIPSNAP family protein [Bacteroidota bacterium]
MNKRTNYLVIVMSGLLIFSAHLSNAQKNEKGRAFYQLTVYHYTSSDQENMLNNYLQHAYLPALHRLGIKNIGVFSSLANDTSAAKLLYVFVPIESLDNLVKIPEKLASDHQYQTAGEEYINAAHTAPAYNRMETILLHAFPLAPQMSLPALKSPKNERVYELRSYESPTEKIFQNKVTMFNKGDEIGLFKRLNFNAVFYSEVVAGSKMPNLMYLTTYENMADRDEHWKKFGSDPYWKQLSAMPEYQHNVSHIDDNFLRPTDYSDF